MKESIPTFNEVIAYFNGKIIVRADDGGLRYYELPAGTVSIGEHFDLPGTLPVATLPRVERSSLKNYLQSLGEL